MSYALVGKSVRVHLYNKVGRVIKSIEGKVSDFSSNVPIKGVEKDLFYITDLREVSGEFYINSAGESGEGWFAVSDCEIIEDSQGPFRNMNFN